MNNRTPIRMVLSSFAGVAQGLLLAWTLTLDRNPSNLFFALFSIVILLVFFHLFSTSVLGRSILVITSYVEGLFFFIVTMISFRIGDQLLGITKLSLRTEIFLFSLAVVFAILYVWAVRMVVQE